MDNTVNGMSGAVRSGTVTAFAAPFGSRNCTEGMYRTQRSTERASNAPPINKWRVHRAACEARTELGLAERSLTVLSALISFVTGTDLDPSNNLVVYPSNATLSLRANGMAEATLRRHLSKLVDAGLIIRRDSPNGKRYTRKNVDGLLTVAFGFDLTPLVVRFEQLKQFAEAARRRREEYAIMRERITLLRREAVKLITLGREHHPGSDWDRHAEQYKIAIAHLGIGKSSEGLEKVTKDLENLVLAIQSTLDNCVKLQEMIGNHAQSERHIQSSNTETHLESEKCYGKRVVCAETTEASQQHEVEADAIPLQLVMRACPDIGDYNRGGIHTWKDFLAATDIVRPMLGISPSAISAANEAFGRINSAVVVASILQRSATIANPGGYLRSLTSKKETSQFTIMPMILAQLRSKSLQ